MTALRRDRRITLVVARADNGVIGAAGGMPWHLPADLRHFKQLTVGKPVVMGRKTWASIGKPLPGRHNIVLTRDRGFKAEGCTVVHTLADALTAADPAPEVMMIGGADLYAQVLPFAHRIHLTEIHASPDGDTCLPAFASAVWSETAREDHPPADDRPGYSFVTLDRRVI